MLAQLTRTAVYGPVRTVVWQGSAGDRGPYADQTASEEVWQRKLIVQYPDLNEACGGRFRVSLGRRWR
jgi:hypothetical protein